MYSQRYENIPNFSIDILYESDMELDYFKLQLQSHLNDHGFEKDDLANDIVIDNAENANNTFEQMRRAGHTVDEAIEFCAA